MTVTRGDRSEGEMCVKYYGLDQQGRLCRGHDLGARSVSSQGHGSNPEQF